VGVVTQTIARTTSDRGWGLNLQFSKDTTRAGWIRKEGHRSYSKKNDQMGDFRGARRAEDSKPVRKGKGTLTRGP